MEEIQDNKSNLKINQPGNNLNYSVISTSYHQLSHFITKGEIYFSFVEIRYFHIL